MEVVLQTSLGKETKANVAIVIAAPNTNIGTNTSKPAEVVNNATHPLINSREVVVVVIILVFLANVPTQIQFQTVVGIESMLEGKLSTFAATKNTPDTNPVLCICSKA